MPTQREAVGSTAGEPRSTSQYSTPHHATPRHNYIYVIAPPAHPPPHPSPSNSCHHHFTNTPINPGKESISSFALPKSALPAALLPTTKNMRPPHYQRDCHPYHHPQDCAVHNMLDSILRQRCRSATALACGFTVCAFAREEPRLSP